jgi:hypothetical protein
VTELIDYELFCGLPSRDGETTTPVEA